MARKEAPGLNRAERGMESPGAAVASEASPKPAPPSFVVRRVAAIRDDCRALLAEDAWTIGLRALKNPTLRHRRPICRMLAKLCWKTLIESLTLT